MVNLRFIAKDGKKFTRNVELKEEQSARFNELRALFPVKLHFRLHNSTTVTDYVLSGKGTPSEVMAYLKDQGAAREQPYALLKEVVDFPKVGHAVPEEVRAQVAQHVDEEVRKITNKVRRQHGKITFQDELANNLRIGVKEFVPSPKSEAL